MGKLTYNGVPYEEYLKQEEEKKKKRARIFLDDGYICCPYIPATFTSATTPVVTTACGNIVNVTWSNSTSTISCNQYKIYDG